MLTQGRRGVSPRALLLLDDKSNAARRSLNEYRVLQQQLARIFLSTKVSAAYNQLHDLPGSRLTASFLKRRIEP